RAASPRDTAAAASAAWCCSTLILPPGGKRRSGWPTATSRGLSGRDISPRAPIAARPALGPGRVICPKRSEHKPKLRSINRWKGRKPHEPPAPHHRRRGGGIMGAFAASSLTTFEQATDRRIVQPFDLVAGNPTGGIIAIGLTMGAASAGEVREFDEN